VVLVARWWSVAAAIGILHRWHKPVRGTTAILTWGGLRGGLAVALALSLPDGPARDATLAITYIVVVFSIVVQGLTMEHLLRRLSARVLQAV
jgi:CPA1 family monovalent cation:H+ antiporter